MANLNLNSKKSGKVKNILIAILILVIIVLGCFVYTKAIDLKDENNKYKDLLEKKENELQKAKKTPIKAEGFNLKNKTLIQSMSYADYFDIVVSKEGEVYLTVNENAFKSEESEEIKKGFTELQKQYKEYKIEGYENKTNVFKGIKLSVSNVIAAYESAGGLAVGDKYILFIKNDGTISSLYTEDVLKGKINIVNNIDNLKNIVSIVTDYASSGLRTIAIDNTGKQYILNLNKN